MKLWWAPWFAFLVGLGVVLVLASSFKVERIPSAVEIEMNLEADGPETDLNDDNDCNTGDCDWDHS